MSVLHRLRSSLRNPNYDLQKVGVLHFTPFIGIQLKQVLDEACKNAKSCNMTMTPPLKSAKNGSKEKEHGGAHFKI